MRVLIIADDLTGALDSAVALAGGLRCVVARRPGDVGEALALGADVVSVSTGSREGSADAARAAVAAALDAVGALPEIVFKKVDSRLKGHVAEELAVLAARSGRSRALVAPAIPAQGRSVVGGKLVGTGVAEPIDVAARLAGSALGPDIPDTRTEKDLDAALERAQVGDEPALLVGAAGLAAAVARKLAGGAAPIPRPPLAAPILLAIGSHDPITLAQVERLAETGEVAFATAPDGNCPASAGGGVVRMVAVEGRRFDPRAAGQRFAEGIARLVKAGKIGTLFACGGETADAILGALGRGTLVIEGEVLPGVPVSSIVIDDIRMQFVTKSGGFGDESALASVVAAVRAQKGSQ